EGGRRGLAERLPAPVPSRSAADPGGAARHIGSHQPGSCPAGRSGRGLLEIAGRSNGGLSRRDGLQPADGSSRGRRAVPSVDPSCRAYPQLGESLCTGLSVREPPVHKGGIGMLNIGLIAAAFGGGAFGAAIGALPAFVFTGIAVLVGVAAALA